MAILEAITETRVYLDTNVFIYAVEGSAEFETELNELFEAFDNQPRLRGDRFFPYRNWLFIGE